ncbi:MAG: TGS domain-containing protein, partial [Acidobacteriales bacterium]|nr:TGS domain-containing protein [Terriglobales bacterium]
MSDMIQVKLPDGSVRPLPRGTTPLEVARSISPRLAEAALAAQIRPTSNGHEPKVVDLTQPLEQDAEVRILTEKDPEALEVYRHSSAHVLATAVLELFP